MDKQEIIDLFNDCNIYVYVDEQIIRYYDKYSIWIGTYQLKTERFLYNRFIFSKVVDLYKHNYLVINELLKPIIEVGIKRKISIIENRNRSFKN